MSSGNLLQRGRAGLCALAILIAGTTGKANSSDNLSSRDQRNTAIDGHGAFKAQESKADSATCNAILEGFCRTLEQSC